MDFRRYAKIIIFLGVFGSAASMVFIRNSQAPPFAMLFYRFLFTSLILLIPVIRKKQEVVDAFKNNAKSFLITAFFLSTAFVMWVYAIKNTSIASAVIISNSHPIIVLIISVFAYKVKYHKMAVIGVLIAFFGCVMMSAFDFFKDGNHLAGDLFAITNAATFGMYLIFAKKLRASISLQIFMFINYSISFFYIATFAVIAKVPLYPYPLEEFITFAILAVFCTCIASGMIDWAIGYVSSAFASLAFLIENVYAIALGIIFLAEFPTLVQIIWGVVLIGGVLLYDKYEYAQ